MVSNLISNSIRHTPIGKEIQVSCRTYLNEDLLHSVPDDDDCTIPEGEVVFTVSDRGDGIPEKDLARVFERNFSGGRRIASGANRHPENIQGFASGPSNSGLGLFISKEIVIQHSGRMGAKNNQYGGAEIFFVTPYYI